MTDSAEILPPAAASSDPTNSEIAAALDELGDLYELDGAVIHRIVAYRNAAKAVRDAPVSITALAREGRATELRRDRRDHPGEGHRRSPTTGEIPALVKLRAKFPPGLIEMTRLPGLGPKRARRLFEELGIDSLDVAAHGRPGAAHPRAQGIRAQGRGRRSSRRSRRPAPASARPRFVLDRALAIADPLVAALREHPASEQVQLAGSARRMTDSVKDLDVIATAHDALALAQAATELELVEQAGTPGEAGVRVRTHTGIQVDLQDRRARSVRQPAPALHRLQAAQHGAARRRRAQGPARLRVRRARRQHRRDAPLRDRGRGLRAARAASTSSPSCARTAASSRRPANGTLPDLIELGDLRGDLHCHTTASDGTASIEEMAAAARDAGYRVPGDHRPLGQLRVRRRPLARAAARAHRADPLDLGRRDRAARRLGGQHPPRRLARLRRRDARPSSTG